MPTSLLTRRSFHAASLGAVMLAKPSLQEPATSPPVSQEPGGPAEAPFTRDYNPPKFKPGWKKQQVNRQLAQDFVIYAHSELEMVKTLLDREPGLLNAAMDWGAGDWETALGGASHMGRRDIVEFLLERGARPDLFCAAMLGQLEVVRSLLTVQPALIDSKGPHGFTLHFHAQVGGEQSSNVLDYLQTVKKLELKPNPFLKMNEERKKAEAEAKKAGK